MSKNLVIFLSGGIIGYLLYQYLMQKKSEQPSPSPSPLPTDIEPAPQEQGCPAGKTMLDLGDGKTECVPVTDYVKNDAGIPEREVFAFNMDFLINYNLNFPPFEQKSIAFQQGEMFEGFVLSEWSVEDGQAVENFYAVTTPEGKLPFYPPMDGQLTIRIPISVLTIQ